MAEQATNEIGNMDVMEAPTAGINLGKNVKLLTKLPG